ncbi:MAG TPA: glutamate 5-kinase [Candidatus Lokiarchaeia archaeon]|nr:glutamate 5-kinase [Candidatus Lokiarchaeia archaeon]
METSWDAIKNAHRIVVKIGTKSVLASDGSFDFKTMAALIYDIKTMVKDEGKELVLVTSGAVAAGMKKLGMKERPRDLVLQQVAASVGQPLLLNEYIRMFDDMSVAQILLTQQDLSMRKSYVHFFNAMEQMLKMKIVPILNENDVVSIDELVGTKSGETAKDYNFSDNDVLSALVAASISADLLIVMSDVDGLYNKHPNAKDAEFLPYVEKITDEILAMGQEGGKLGRGGMGTKLKAAQICTMAGVWMIICHAKKTNVGQLLSEGAKCTIFKPAERLPGKKVWMVFAANVGGRVMLDQGAVEAVKDGASILLPGVTKVIGNFNKNDVIEFWDEEHNKILGKGMANLSSSEIERFLNLYHESPNACKSQDVGEIIRRDNLAIFI